MSVQAAVVPAAEWRRIKDSLCQRERERAEQCKARDQRQERRAQSERIVKNWENTIEVWRLGTLCEVASCLCCRVRG